MTGDREFDAGANLAVRQQYEALPYPARDPEDERRRLIEGSPSHILELNHYVFGGRRDFRQPFRALVAGGGTGDGAIMLAQHLATACGPGEVVYVDPSAASRAVAERRAAVRGLANIVFITGTIEDLPGLAAGTFDYIDCCGVLHHLADPARGLAALVGLLAPQGGLGLMVYGPFGRTGVYPAQDLLRQLVDDGPPVERARAARRIIDALPPSNWLKRNPFVGDYLSGGDAGLFDLLLHARDRAYTVAQVADLLDPAGLAITAFIEPAAYDPRSYVSDPNIRKRAAGLGLVGRATMAELLAGNMAKHVFYAVRRDDFDRAVARPDAPEAVPVLRMAEDDVSFAATRAGGSLAATFNGVKVHLPWPGLARPLLAAIDGVRTIDEIAASVSVELHIARGQVLHAFAELYETLNGAGRLYLRSH
ncbi:MAG: methyltransferase [Proteobacteria bacterium]|nr:methyltransferase [Pseudomonadota bacterium]